MSQDFSHLRALFLNCTLKPGSEPSNTQALMDNAIAIMEAQGVQVETVRVADLDVPPGVQPDMTEIGETGPGPSYADPDSGGLENEFTQRNTTFMTWNLMHMARMLKDAGGIPAEGNRRAAWDAGARFDHPNPEYR